MKSIVLTLTVILMVMRSLAATLTVTSLSDDGLGSLRAMIASAGASDTIRFGTTGTIFLARELVIRRDLNIEGLEPGAITLDGGGKSRLLTILAGTVRVAQINFRNGHFSGITGPEGGPETEGGRGGDGVGGAIFNNGRLILNQCRVVSCSAVGGAGGKGGDGFGGGGGLGGQAGSALGGGICNSNELLVADCLFEGNTASGQVGGDGGASNHGEDIGVPAGRGGDARGGAIFNAGTLLATNTSFHGNFAVGGKGGTGGDSSELGGDGGAGGNAEGGALSSSSRLFLVNCTLSENQSLGGKGGPGGGGLGFGNAGDGGSVSGGALSISVSGDSQLVHCSIGDNLAKAGEPGEAFGGPGARGLEVGGGLASGATTTMILNTLMTRNRASGALSDVEGRISSRGHNLISVTNGSRGWAPTDQTGSRARPLTAQVGTAAHQDQSVASVVLPLLPGSPAIDAGDDDSANPPLNLTSDQRRYPRRIGPHVDVGAFEWSPARYLYVTTIADTGPGSLRQVIQEANLSAGYENIWFNLPGPGPHTLSPRSPLPALATPATIDGYTQPTAIPNTSTNSNNAVLQVILDGQNRVNLTDGLTVAASGCVLRGLDLVRWPGAAIRISGASNRVSGCYLGLNQAGTLPLGNGSGLLIDNGAGCQIGGGTPADQNLISGNVRYGVWLRGPTVTSASIQGNYIGVGADGMVPLPNQIAGIQVEAGSSRNTIGPLNLIAHNGSGIFLGSGTHNRVSGNSIHSNLSAGFDLAPAGATENDPQDSDLGANGLQNFPTLELAWVTPSFLTLLCSVDSSPLSSAYPLTLDFYATRGSERQGDVYLGSDAYTSADAGLSRILRLPLKVGLADTQQITAIATDALGNSSEFSVPRPWSAAGSSMPRILINGVNKAGQVTVTNRASIQLSALWPNALIFYSLDGSHPSQGVLYGGPFELRNSATIRAIAFSEAFDPSPEAFPALLTVIHPPSVRIHPQDRQVTLGGSTTLSVEADGTPPLSYQWYHNGVQRPGATNSILLLRDFQAADTGVWDVVVRNPGGEARSDEATLSQVSPLHILSSPDSVTVDLQSPPPPTVTLRARATGNLPLSYQWRKTGVNIPGATGASYTLRNIQASDGGTYDVVVADSVSAAATAPAVLTVNLAPVSDGDDFTTPILLDVESNSVAGLNSGATRQSGERNHGGKHGTHSVWFLWFAGRSGVVEFNTAGSTFDTLLAVYTGDAFDQLQLVTEDDDSAGFLASRVRFNAERGRSYRIALDGFANENGRFVLNWRLTPESNRLPVIQDAPPRFVTLSRGQSTTLRVTTDQDNVSYQWFFNGVALPGAENSTLEIRDLEPSEVGFYSVAITNRASGLGLVSDITTLEIGAQPGTHSEDKFEDLDESPQGEGAPPAPALMSLAVSELISLRAGYVDSHFLNNKVATTQASEPIHCGKIGTGTRWLRFVNETAIPVICAFNTLGSEIETVLAVYEVSGGVRRIDQILGCGISPGPGNSSVAFQLGPSQKCDVVLDGLDGARGLIYLNWAVSSQLGLASDLNSVRVPRGGRTTLGLGITQTSQLSFQWLHNESLLPGSDAATLTLTNIQPRQAGTYSVLVRSNATTVWKRPVANLEVDESTIVLADSTFDQNAEAWSKDGDATLPAYHQSGSVPGGYITLTNSGRQEWFWSAPSRFLGDQSGAYEGSLNFSLRQTGGTSAATDGLEIVLTGRLTQLRYRSAGRPLGSWGHFKIPLTERASGWTKAVGERPTQSDLLSTLRSLEALQIGGRALDRMSTIDLDNVALVGICTNTVVLLDIQPASGPGLEVSWPANAVWFELEGAGELPSLDWRRVDQVPEVTDRRNSVRIEPSSPSRFFRLRQRTR